MRMTVGSVAVCVAVCLSIMALWPNNQITPPTALAVAQEAVDPFAADEPAKGGKKRAEKGNQDPMGLPGATSQASEKKKLVPHTPKNGDASQSPEANNRATELKLTRRMKVSYVDVPLRDVLDGIAETYDIDLFINRKHLSDSVVDLNDPEFNVDLNFKNISGEMLLDLVLRNAQLNYTIHDGIVVITTADDVDNMLEVRVYNCRDLVALMQEHPAQAGMIGMGMGMGMSSMPPGGGYGGMAGAPGSGGMAGMPGMSGAGAPSGGMAGMEMMGGAMGGSASGFGGGGVGNAQLGGRPALIQALTNTVMPDSWDTSGGSGTIEAYHGGLLIVNNNPTAHRKIDKLLKMIRDVAQQPPGSVVSEK